VPAHSDGHQFEAEDDCRICLRRGSEQEAKPKKRQHKILPDDDEQEEPAMTKTIHGKIHGKTIELDEDLGVTEGQDVEVQVTIVQPARKWGEGILRTAGALADDPEWDTIMEQTHQGRKGDMS